MQDHDKSSTDKKAEQDKEKQSSESKPKKDVREPKPKPVVEAGSAPKPEVAGKEKQTIKIEESWKRLGKQHEIWIDLKKFLRLIPIRFNTLTGLQAGSNFF